MTPRPAHKRRPWRKRLTRAFLCLLLGAATTVGVAWGAAWSRKGVGGAGWGGGLAIVIADGGNAHWGTSYFAVQLDPEIRIHTAKGPPAGTSRHEVIALIREHASDVGASWARIPSEDGIDVAYSSQAAGWPKLALWGWHEDTRGAEADEKAGGLIVLGQTDLPWLPLWPGFFVDTLLFASPWMLLVAAFEVRCALRKRRGRCIHCGYDLAGLRRDDDATPTCPECGA